MVFGFKAMLRFQYMIENETMGTIEMRQSLAGGVPKRKWFVAVVRSNYEAVCRDMLQKMGYEAYVASQKRIHRYKNRHQREVEKIVIPRMVFVRISGERERLDILKNCQLVKSFMLNHAASPNEMGRSPFAVIPEHQMDTLQYMLYHADGDVKFVSNPLAVGDRVKVMRGALEGVEGKVVILNDMVSQGVGIQVDFLGYAVVTLSIDDLEKI